jgi:dihydrofolate synthase/folylpolyglutamate synthase
VSWPDGRARLTDPEKYLAELEPVGWRFGLERMHALCEELGWPQRRYRSLHVVGTNGKSSVTTMTAELLSGSGLRSGACISPHVRRWSERTRIDGGEVSPEAFGAAIERVAAATASVERTLADGERITQFEAAIAASFVAFAAAKVDIAVIEAGLGGRLDATNVISSTATALTSIGLDHIEWLGETELEIAAEKLAVLRPGTTLVVGDLSPEVEELAHETAGALRADVVVAEQLSAVALRPAMAPYLQRNAAVAVALAETVTGSLDPKLISTSLSRAELPGRAQLIEGDPPRLADSAHNESGARALAETLANLAPARPVFACLSVLADKDFRAIASALAPQLTHAVCTSADPGPAMGRPGSRALVGAELARVMAAAGVDSEAIDDPDRAIERTLELAREGDGVALFAGSHYLLRYLWTVRHAPNYSR